MKWGVVIGTLLCCLCCSAVIAQDSDWQAAIEQRLQSQFALTQTTPDNISIKSQGSTVTISKPNLVVISVETPNVVPNTYKNGKISQSLFGSFNRLPGMSQNKTMPVGGQLYITKIEVKNDGVVFDLLSDVEGGTRYKASLRFPLSKNSQPSPDQVSALVAEVFEAPGGNKTGGHGPAPTESETTSREATNTALHLDIVGVQLGMTIKEAQAALLKYRPDLLIALTYATDNSSYWAEGQGLAPEWHDAYYKARLRVPIGIVAGHVDKIYAKENPYSSDTALKILTSRDVGFTQFSGEFFRLKFTPTDNGGRLYSIVREKIYAFDSAMPLDRYSAAGMELPAIADLDTAIVNKYGEPANKGRGPFVGFTVNEPLNGIGWKNQNTAWAATGSVWLYNRKGNAVAMGSSDFDRCTSHFEFPYKRSAFYSPMKPGAMTLNEIQDAFADKDYSSAANPRRAGRTDPEEVVQDFESNFDLASSPRKGNGNYRGCGTQLQLFIFPTVQSGKPTNYAGSMIVSLTDQDATFSDNGVAAYMKPQVDKMSNVAPPAPKKESF